MRIASVVLSVAVLGAWAAGPASAQEAGLDEPVGSPESDRLKTTRGEFVLRRAAEA